MTDSSRLRPLHLVESWSPVRTGYTMRSLALVGAQQRSTGIEPRVLVSSRQSVHGTGAVDQPDGVSGFDLGERLRVVSPSPREQTLRRVRPFTVDGRHLETQLLRAIDELGAELVHTHWSSTIGWAGLQAARARGLPLVAEVRFDLAGAMTAQSVPLRSVVARNALEQQLRAHFERHLPHADAVVAAGPSLAALLERSVPGLAGRVRVAANGCEPDRFTPGPADPELIERYQLRDRLVVGTTATMLRYEGLDLLIEAASRLRSRYPELVLMLIGDGPEWRRLGHQAERLGVRCVLARRVPPEQIAAHYRLLDVMAIPRRDVAVTRYAGPLKLVEAMAAGRACLASAVGDITELLSDGRGQLVPPSDLDALTDGLDALLSDSGLRLRLGEAARRFSLGAGGWDAAAQVHRVVYDQLLGSALVAG